MSQRTTNPSTSRIQGRRALRWFDRAIWHDYRICSECFARVKESATDERDEWGNLSTRSWRTPSASIGYDLEDPPSSIASTVPISRPRTTCEECGSVRAIRTSETLTKREALDRVPALAERLREEGYDVDEELMEFAVGHCKSESNLSGDDRHVFAAAAAFGIDL